MRRGKYAVTVADELGKERIVYPVAYSAQEARDKVERQIKSNGLTLRILVARYVGPS